MVKTVHTDKHGDEMTIYSPEGSKLIFIDGIFDDHKIAWRGIYTPYGAREIAKRLNDMADIMEGK